MSDPAERRLTVKEHPQVPWLSIVLGYGPMLPFAAGAAAAWLTTGELRRVAMLLTVLWAGAILAFLSGVRRGLSFRTGGGPTVAQVATMLVLFVLALGALAAADFDLMIVAVVLLLVGFAALLVLDPIAARRGEAPLFFARLRPPQIAIAVVSLAALLARLALAG